MNGYRGKLLRVNLTDGSIVKEDLDMDLARKYLGGRGLGTAMMAREVDPAVDALSPDNKLMIMTGPLSGNPAPTGGRYMVITKSPLTGTIASSNSGGYWGAELKFAGYDGIIVEGKASEPVVLKIEDDEVSLQPAGSLWGKLVGETTDRLVEETSKKHRVLTIGPAGERLSPIASVMNEKGRAAGRSGVGAVMGSKNLKAIVVRGTTKPQVANPDALKEVNDDGMKKIKDSGVTGSALPSYGTAVLVNIINELGVFPTNNFQFGSFEPADDISGETLAEKYLLKKDPCYRCPIGCGRYSKNDNVEGQGPEYETIWAYGASCGVSDMSAIIDANFWCNEYGMDTISAGATIACAMELKEKGYLDGEDLGDVPLEFGNNEAIVHWTKKMGAGEGFGAKMDQGSWRLADSYGVPELSMSVKKQELPAYDPRAIKGMGITYATSNRGGCHVRGYMISAEVLAVPEKLDRNALEGKAKWTKTFQDITAFIDSSGLCLFTSFALWAEEYANYTNAICGTDYTADDVMEIGERIYTLEKLFNIQAGITPDEDTLPTRLLEDPIPDGPSKGSVHELGQLLPEYYKLRGWDDQGVPTTDTLSSLGIDLA